MTILNEGGTPDVLSPLHAVYGLAARLAGTMVVVIGTRTETHAVQSLSTAFYAHLRHNRRVVFVVLDPHSPPAQGRLASQLVAAAAGLRGIDSALLLAGRSASLIGVDAGFESRLLARRLELPVGLADLDDGAPGCLSTDLEDRAMAALVDLCPKGTVERARGPETDPRKRRLLGGLLRRERDEPPERRSPVVLLGTSAGTARELAEDLERTGTEVAGMVPAVGREGLPPIDEDSVVALMDPYLAGAARVAGERGARVVRTLMPIGVNGTARFVQDVAAAAGTPTSEAARARGMWERLDPLRNRMRGKRVFFAGDTGLEIPLARFLADSGAVVLEVGAPRLDRRLLTPEIQALGADVDVVESPDWQGQIERADEYRPDLVIASPGLYGPLVARGHLCRSSLDLLNLGVHGYEGARRVLEMLTRTFDRAEALDSLNL